MKTPVKSFGLTIEYIRHSGFIVESDQSLLVFDYYEGPIQFPATKKIYVFTSHVHQDHFNPEIFLWQKEHPHIHYILSSDIKGNPNLPPSTENITFLSPYDETRLDDLRIKAYGSTDAGISFLVEHVDPEGFRIFHAGDLNWWHWWGEPPEAIENAERIFKEEIAKIKGESIDLAFFPVDPRLEQYYSIGAEYFIQELKPHILVPMHFWDQYEPLQIFAQKLASSPTHILTITQPNQIFTI
ncbi:hypothetical protein Desdi_3485 [Desulfitobacterium dichloroeliminans LMG P-21439]|uniref:Zn-dependent hydrolase of beta-lactamase fold protein n=1 Tax=Desulfitobacterium dichloroeliminans (strain LMG P-21439 / DCA1) TaxID=871963 RepID=L0FDZ0_DESDL|nr:MBL fold metallo-hydrolase [Desulfitobacterium dichloroeliminans]AGA70871.1 hypothetical protein Desdi_3485 [Desulfitobacterium dichloroeliminans LMG P-21439]